MDKGMRETGELLFMAGCLRAAPMFSAIQRRLLRRRYMPMVYLSFTFDHRILDGASADGFLAKVVEALEDWG